MAGEVTAILEIGTSNIRCLVGEVRDDNIVSIVAIGESKSKGIRKGEISNHDDAISSIRNALKNTEKNYRKNIHSIVLTLSGGNTSSFISEGIHKVADYEQNIAQEVLLDDINQVTTIAEKIVLNEKRIRLHSLQQYFQVDDMKQVLDPIGLRCETLKLEMLIVHGKRSVVSNFQKLVSDVPINCVDAVYSGLGSSLAVTNEEMRKAGVLIIDLGGGTTDYIFYYDGLLKKCGSLTLGGDHITNDIATGLQIPIKNAEELKIKEGSALSNLLERDRNISLPSDTQGFSGKIIRAVTLNTIIEARIEEIFQLIKKDINESFQSISLGAGILLTGGGSYLNGTRDLAQRVFDTRCIIGKPIDVQGLPSSHEGPNYAALIGCIRYSNKINKKVYNPSLFKRFFRMIWG